MANAETKIYAVDWGTTSFRAYRVAADGTVLEQMGGAKGILAVESGQFADVLLQALAPWLGKHGQRPVLLSGMIGSRQGWHEVPYVPAPACAVAVAAGLHRFAADQIGAMAIIPGVIEQREGHLPDVMRGEETQVWGALALLGLGSSTFVLPGTHSKWVNVADGQILGFRTYMTGEVFAALKGHTILGRLIVDRSAALGAGAEPLSRGFVRGLDVAKGREGLPGALLHRLFSARTLGLVGELPGEEISDYLSGLLIGSEIIDAGSLQQGEGGSRHGGVIIIGGEDLAARYTAACRYLGIAAKAAPPNAAAAGMALIARLAGLGEKP